MTISDYMTISDSSKIKKYYQNKACAQQYFDQRFSFPLGRILHEKQVSVVNRYINLIQPRRILELACGPGRVTLDIEPPINAKCVAVDASEEMLNVAKERLVTRNKQQWVLKREDIFVMDLQEKFELIFSFRFVRHFKKNDRSKIYRTVKRHLTKDGFFIFDVVNKDISFPLRLKEGLDKYPVYDKLYTRDEFLKEMREEDFLVKELIPTYPRYSLLYKIQIYLGPHSERLTYKLLRLIENNCRTKNLEWIAVCQSV